MLIFFHHVIWLMTNGILSLFKTIFDLPFVVELGTRKIEKLEEHSFGQ